MKMIILTNEGEVIVDDEDYDYLSQWAWQNDNNKAVRRTACKNGIKEAILMHRVIAERMGLNIENMDIDHKDGNPLNDQRSNLRVATDSQNLANQKIRDYPKWSIYKGVYYHTSKRKWIAQIRVNRRNYHLGNYDIEEEAAKAYDRAARMWFGEFAKTNFELKEETNDSVD